MIRRRYSVWQALGDIGGFFDGIKLVVSLLIAPISGAYYLEETLKGKLYTPRAASDRTFMSPDAPSHTLN